MIDSKPNQISTAREWNTPPKPPRRYSGPARFGGPVGEYSRIEELEARVRRLETALGCAGLPVPGEPL
jgi:hypothetical protein